MTSRDEVEDILAGWRGVQRRLEDLPDGAPEAKALHEEASRLRREYQAEVGKAVARFRATPPPDASELDRRAPHGMTDSRG